ncbi:MAG: alpha/beta hydrolase [Acidobacteriia bacterium]|nr:alpha/beta hydrolase [Terriglobia bacterium]
MMNRTSVAYGAAIVVPLLALPAGAQQLPVWRDPSPHRVHFVTVEEGVRLEVLEWPGPGRNVVLMAGSGNSAHVFDDFAPKLTKRWHVYAITRRGYGASSQPPSGYGDQRLADDVVQVLDSLGIAAPVLVGHSMAGGELTTVGRRHSNRLSGLVYLDALGDPRDWPASDPAYMALYRKLPPSPDPPVAPESAEEKKSFSGSRAAQLRIRKFAVPESELRNVFETNPDGTKGEFKTPPEINAMIGDGQIRRDYAGIRVPVLAFFEFPRPSRDLLAVNPSDAKGAEELAAKNAFDAATTAFIDRWTINLLRGVADVHLVDLPGAGHYLFLTRAAEVLRELDKFLASLP